MAVIYDEHASSFYGDVPSYDGNVLFQQTCDVAFGYVDVGNLINESALPPLNDGAFFLGGTQQGP